MSMLVMWLLGGACLLVMIGVVIGYIVARLAFKAELQLGREMIKKLYAENETLRDQVVADWCDKWVQDPENEREVRYSERADLELGQPASRRLDGDTWLTREERMIEAQRAGEAWRRN